MDVRREDQVSKCTEDLCRAVEGTFNPIDLFFNDENGLSDPAHELMKQVDPGWWDRYHAFLESLKGKQIGMEIGDVDSMVMDFGTAKLHIGLLLCGYLFALKGQGVDSETLRRQAMSVVSKIQGG